MSLGDVSSYSVKRVNLCLIPHHKYRYPLYIFSLANAIMHDTAISHTYPIVFILLGNYPQYLLTCSFTDKFFVVQSMHLFNYIKSNVISFHSAYSHSSIPVQYNGAGPDKHQRCLPASVLPWCCTLPQPSTVWLCVPKAQSLPGTADSMGNLCAAFKKRIKNHPSSRGKWCEEKRWWETEQSGCVGFTDEILSTT